MARNTNKTMRKLATLGIASVALILGACRGGTSKSPPVHLVLDMDFQPKLKAQATSGFEGWHDHRSMRLPVEGTVARGSLPDPVLMPNPAAPGKNADGSWITANPLPRTIANLERGREQYDIYCSICHGYSGRGGNGDYGHGMVGRLWPVAVPNFHVQEGKDNRVANLSDGEIFDVLSDPKGRNTMPSYSARIRVEDRWAIIHYVRALQELGQ